MSQTIYLEFKHQNGALAANGTDTTFYIDGRWSWATTARKIHERVAELRKGPFGSRYSQQLFVGFTYSQHPYYNGKGGAIHSMHDHNPPAWAEKVSDSAMLEPSDIPDDYEVRPISDDTPAGVKMTCMACSLSWDDSISTSMTPAPSGRCPFEQFHIF